MYFELTAPNLRLFNLAIWEAEVSGLDPEPNANPLTFNIGTGSIEKVSRIRDKFSLTETYWSDIQPTGYLRR